MFEKDDLCEKVDKKQCLKSLNSVNSEIDNEIAIYEDKGNALEALICKYCRTPCHSLNNVCRYFNNSYIAA